MISAFAARDRAQPSAAMAEPLDPTLKAPRLHHSANGDLPSSLRALTLTPTASSPSPDLLKFPFHKPHLANGGSRHSYPKPHTSNGDTNRAKTCSFHGDLARPALSSKLLPLLRILPFKRRLLIVSSFFVLLMLAFSVARMYPARMHPFLVDLGEEKERAQANNILDGTLSRPSSHSRYSYTRDRYRHDDHYRDRSYERPRPSESRYQRLPMQLSSPRFRPFWAQFRSSLRSWVQNKHYDPHIMTLLLSSVKEPIDHHYLTSNQTVTLGKPYKTCAVVGNSGILLNQTHGSFIDRHDMVMRLNNARINGFEKHVGFKTTLSFVNSNILHSCSHKTGCYCHPYGKNVPLVMYICQVVHLMDVAMCSASLQAPIIVTDARFDTLCARIVKYYSLKRFVEATGQRLEDWSNTHEGPLFHYSSGMQAVLLAVGICEKVSIFGFGKSDNSKHHYHTTQRAELRLHDYGAEYDFYMDLALQNAEIIPFLNEAGFSLPSVHIYW